jgi:hypothetical protein
MAVACKFTAGVLSQREREGRLPRRRTKSDKKSASSIQWAAIKGKVLCAAMMPTSADERAALLQVQSQNESLP